jgi:hypothetical protein
LTTASRLAVIPVVILRRDEVTKISAYKIDLGTVDQICVGVHTFRSVNCVELQEEWDGYKAVVAEIERRFSIADGWLPKATFPAFQENYTVLYAR